MIIGPSAGDTALELVYSTQKLLEDDPEGLGAAARASVRIARLTRSHEDLFWLRYELIDSEMATAKADLVRELSESMTTNRLSETIRNAEERYHEERGYTALSGLFIKPREVCISAPLDTLVEMLRACRAVAQNESSLARVYAERDAKNYETILSRIRERIFNFLARTEQQLLIGHANAAIFESHRQRVDEQLATIAPDIMQQFASIYRRINENDVEARSHALTSCRRVIKAFADLFFPVRDGTAEGRDGKEYPLDDDHYILRLRQFIKAKSSQGKAGDLLLAQLGDLEIRLDALNALANKGAHAVVSPAELNQCAIQTYLVAGDLLQLRDR